VPTAKQFVAVVQETLVRLLRVLFEGLGLGTMLQLLPSQCSTNVERDPESGSENPTAKQFVVLVHDTPVR